MRPTTTALITAIAFMTLAGTARADCSHADYENKYNRVQQLIGRLDQSDPAKAAALAQQVADIESQNQGRIIDLGHACGSYDVILMKNEK